MNNEVFEKSKKNLEELRKQNDNQILINDEKTRMACVNKFEYKVGKLLATSIIPYFLILLLSAILTQFIGTAIINNIFPATLIGSSLIIGTIGVKLFDKKYKPKERLKTFSNAKTQTEILEEEIYYQIEMEKAINRNKVLDEAKNLLNSNQSILSKISMRYELDDKNAPQSKEEASQKVKELSEFIKKQYNELDIATTKKVLHERFWKVRYKFHRITDFLMISMLIGVVMMCLTAFPIITMQSSLMNLITPLASFTIGAVGGSVYMLKRNRDYRKVFKNLNNELGENTLKENCDEKFESAFEEEQEIDALIENQIRDISLAEIQRQENERYLDTFITEEDKRKTIIEQSYAPLKITEKTREDVLTHPERYTNCDVRTRMGKFYTDEEYEQRREEGLSRPLPDFEEKGPSLSRRKKEKTNKL